MTAGKRKDQELATARRHVREGADRVARQEALVLRLNRLGHVELAQQAHRILSTLKASLTLAREDLLEQVFRVHSS
jgi:hypothetical protein